MRSQFRLYLEIHLNAECLQSIDWMPWNLTHLDPLPSHSPQPTAHTVARILHLRQVHAPAEVNPA